MATATHSSTSKSKSRSAAAKKAAATRAKNAINLLKADHREVEKLFGQFTKAKGEDRKAQLSSKICMELKVHTQIEEEIFYPACRDVLDDEDLINEAIVEHQAAKDLIGQIEGMDASDEMFDARMQVLCEQITHHVKEEETELFPKVQKTKELDMQAIGERLAARKKELMAQMKGDGMEMH
jgi:hemerythrin superfamily protein